MKTIKILHLFPKGKAVNAFFKAGIIIYLLSQRHLSSCR